MRLQINRVLQEKGFNLRHPALQQDIRPEQMKALEHQEYGSIDLDTLAVIVDVTGCTVRDLFGEEEASPSEAL